jgi:hypothetical protein
MNEQRVDYRATLTPSQAREMGRFLHSLLWASDRAKEAGVRPNIDLFMRSWIGLPIGAEEKKNRHRQFQADYRKRKQQGKKGRDKNG